MTSSIPAAAMAARVFRKTFRALTASSAEVGYQSELLKAVENVNAGKSTCCSSKMHALFRRPASRQESSPCGAWRSSRTRTTCARRRVASWSRSCGTRAPTCVLTIRCAMQEALRLYGERADFVLCERAEDALEGADALAIVTEWREFRSPDFDSMKRVPARSRHFRRPQLCMTRNSFGIGGSVITRSDAVSNLESTERRSRERAPSQRSQSPCADVSRTTPYAPLGLFTVDSRSRSRGGVA